MSAIGAIFCERGVPEETLDTLKHSLAQFPHDEVDGWRAGPFALAAATLHTHAESRQTRQPATCADGRIAAVFDGYLLNADNLLQELEAKGLRPRDESDVAIVMGAYRAWGEACAPRLEGEFALIIADQVTGKLFAIRDHMGLVPLYYRKDGDRLLVASDFRTLSHVSRSTLKPDHDYLAQVLAKSFHLREATPWQGVKRIVRAHTLSFDAKRIRTDEYWSPPTDVTIRYQRDEDYAEHYRELLFDEVRRASRSDGPVAFAVSGGLDSTALFCVADRLKNNGELLAPGLRGYTFAADEGSNAYELPYAHAAARETGREIIECPLFDPDIDWYAQDARERRDIAIPSNGAMMLGIDRQVVADGCRVIINGTGGDEWLQGNRLYYREFLRDGAFAQFGRAFRDDAAAAGWPSAIAEAARHVLAELTPAPIARRIRMRLHASRQARDKELFWLKPEWRERLREAEAQYRAALPEDPVKWVKHNLAKAPRGDLSHEMMARQRAEIGLQSRHPMLSRRFIEFSVQTPAHIKSRGGIGKIVHRQAMRGILPDEVLNRQSKANFTNVSIDTQFADYMRNRGTEQLADLCDMDGIARILNVDFTSPEGDLWAWEIWGLYAASTFLYIQSQMTVAHIDGSIQEIR